MIGRFFRTFGYVLIHAVPYAIVYYVARRLGFYHTAWIFGLVAIAVARAIAYPFIGRRKRPYNRKPKEAHNDYHRRNRH